MGVQSCLAIMSKTQWQKQLEESRDQYASVSTIPYVLKLCFKCTDFSAVLIVHQHAWVMYFPGFIISCWKKKNYEIRNQSKSKLFVTFINNEDFWKET